MSNVNLAGNIPTPTVPPASIALPQSPGAFTLGTGVPPGGAGGGMSPAERAARQVEEQIRDHPTESLYAFDASGQLVYTKTGGQRDIGLNLAEIALLRGTVLTHNHPAGNSLSPADLQVAALGDLAEIRVVTSAARFILRRPASGWDWAYFRDTLEPVLLRQREQTLRDLLLAVNAGSLAEDEAHREYTHEVLLRVARELGLEYRREP